MQRFERLSRKTKKVHTDDNDNNNDDGHLLSVTKKETKTVFQLYFFMKICENLGEMVMFMTFDFRSRVTFDRDNIFGNFDI